MSKNYIKVTPKGEKKSFILQASLENHYRSLGAKIEEPTEEEIASVYPEARATKNASKSAPTGADADVIAAKDNLIKDLENEIAANEAKLAKANEEKEALAISLKEAEARLAEFASANGADNKNKSK